MATDHESPPSSASDDGSYWDFGLVNVDGGVVSTLAGAASTCITGDAADVLQPRKSCRVPDSFAHRLSYVSGGSINYHSHWACHPGLEVLLGSRLGQMSSVRICLAVGLEVVFVGTGFRT